MAITDVVYPPVSYDVVNTLTMPQASLHNIRVNSQRQCVVAILLLAWLSLSLAISWHSASHVVHPDNHCSLCTASGNNDHVVAHPVITIGLVVKPLPITAETPAFFSIQHTIPGNRDPPFTV